MTESVTTRISTFINPKLSGSIFQEAVLAPPTTNIGKQNWKIYFTKRKLGVC